MLVMPRPTAATTKIAAMIRLEMRRARGVGTDYPSVWPSRE